MSIPLFPLGTVLYPGGLLPLRIFEPRYLDMVRAALRDRTPFGIVAIRHGREVGMTPHFFEEGTLASIESWDQGADGLLHIRVLGGRRFRVQRHEIRPDLLLVGEVEYLAAADDQPVPEQFRHLAELLQQVFAHGAAPAPAEPDFDSALWVAYRLAEVLPLTIADKYDILQNGDGRAKLARIEALLAALRHGAGGRHRH